MSEWMACKTCAKILKIGEEAYIVETSFLPKDDWECPIEQEFYYLCKSCQVTKGDKS